MHIPAERKRQGQRVNKITERMMTMAITLARLVFMYVRDVRERKKEACQVEKKIYEIFNCTNMRTPVSENLVEDNCKRCLYKPP